MYMKKSLAVRQIVIPFFILAVIVGSLFMFSSSVSASAYTECIDACGGSKCTASQVEHCRRLPGAGLNEPSDVIDPGGSGSFGLTNPLEFDTIEGLLDRIANVLFTLSIPLLVIMIIIGAFYLITAGGSEQKVTTGKNVIKWAIIGFVIILLAGSVASLIRNLLEG